MGDKAEAEKCAQKGLELEEVCLGTDNPFYTESLQRVKKIEAGEMREELK